MSRSKLSTCLIPLVAAVAAVSAHAGPVGPIDSPAGLWSGWTQFQFDPFPGNASDEDETLTPGVGGQPFDAEFLFWKIEAGKLFLGLQTGFNLITGHQTVGSDHYYAGDLALAFNAVGTAPAISTNSNNYGSVGPANYRYAIDFGLATGLGLTAINGLGAGNPIEDDGNNDGIDPAGFYKVDQDDQGNVVGWSQSYYDAGGPNPGTADHTASNPFAMDESETNAPLFSLASNVSGQGTGADSDQYYRQVSVNLSDLVSAGLLNPLNPAGTDIDVHWTMSCGNDGINGRFRLTTVPEPGLLAMLSVGLLSLGWMRRQRSRRDG